jgi:hypothetical protein
MRLETKDDSDYEVQQQVTALKPKSALRRRKKNNERQPLDSD